MNIRSFISPVAAALALALFAVPTMASADEAPEGDKAELVAKKGKHKGQENRLEFPMTADKFSSIVDQRIAKVTAKVERVLTKRNAPPELRAAVLADLERATKQVQAAADKAEADGTVTKEEAKEVRKVAHQVRKAAGEKYGNQLGRKDKANKKGQRGKRANRR